MDFSLGVTLVRVSRSGSALVVVVHDNVLVVENQLLHDRYSLGAPSRVAAAVLRFIGSGDNSPASSAARPAIADVIPRHAAAVVGSRSAKSQELRRIQGRRRYISV